MQFNGTIKLVYLSPTCDGDYNSFYMATVWSQLRVLGLNTHNGPSAAFEYQYRLTQHARMLLYLLLTTILYSILSHCTLSGKAADKTDIDPEDTVILNEYPMDRIRDALCLLSQCSARSRLLLRAISTSFPLSLSISLTVKLQLLASRRFFSSIFCILYETIVVHAH